MKRRTLTIVVGLLLCLSLIGVGFASWVITAGDTDEVTGNIQVEDVTDKRLELSNVKIVTNSTTEDKTSFIFGKGTKGTNSWLEADGIADEVLTATISFDLAYKNGTDIDFEGEDRNTNLSVTFDDATKTLLEGAVTAGYIEAVPTLTVTGSNGSYSVSVTFEWGALFNNQNPFTWYNNNSVDGKYSYDAKGLSGIKGADGVTTATYGDHAAKYINEMFDYFTGKTYKVVVDAQPYTAPAN